MSELVNSSYLLTLLIHYTERRLIAGRMELGS